MISGLVLAFSSHSAPTPLEKVARSLAILVPAAMESVVADVVLVGPSRDSRALQDLQTIADHAGCLLVSAATEGEGLQSALGAARRGLVLVLRAGYAPGAQFANELSGFAARAAAAEPLRAAALRARRRGLAGWSRRGPVVALLGRRPAMMAAQGADLDELARRLRPDAFFTCGAAPVS